MKRRKEKRRIDVETKEKNFFFSFVSTSILEKKTNDRIDGEKEM